MKRISFVVLIVLLAFTVVSAQTWMSLRNAPGTVKRWTQQVIKERLTKADSTTYRVIVGTDTTIRIRLGTLPARSMITGVQVYVAEAFNQTHGSKKDSVTIGSAYNPDEYMTVLAVSSTGVKSGSLTSSRYVAADSVLYLYFLRQGTILGKTGDVCAGIEFLEFPQ
jgi:hypothetical protein